ncbi:MAG: RND family transporter [Euryarchaeota archaeon]|nr:RND family transporter [Euryarchaeota archaeon]
MTIKNMFEKLGIFIENNAIPILIIALLLIFVAIGGAQQIEMKSGTDTFVEKTSQLYQDYDHLYLNLFGKESVVVIVEGNDVRNAGVLEAIDRLEQMAAPLPNVVKTSSAASVIKNANYQMTGRSLIPSGEADIKQLAASHVPDYLLPDETHTLVFVKMAGDITDNQKQEVLRELNLAVEMSAFPPDYKVIVTGDPAFTISMNEEMMSSMRVLLMFSVILMVFVLYLVFKHVRWRLMPLAIVLLGIIYTFGAMGYLNIPMTMVSTAAFPVLIGLGIDYAIQFHNRIEEELDRGESPAEAVVDTIKHTGPAVLIALTITALGFISLSTSPVPMIQDFSKLLLIGIVMCFLSSLFIGVTIIYNLDSLRTKRAQRMEQMSSILDLPLLRNLFRPDAENNGVEVTNADSKQGPDIIGRLIQVTTAFTLKHPAVIMVIAVVLCANGLYVDSFVPIETDTQTFVPQDMQALLDLKHLSDITGGDDQLNLIIKVGDVTDPAVLHWMDDFARHEVERRDNIYSSDSIVKLIKSMNGGMIPDSSGDIERLYGQMSEEKRDMYMYGSNTLLLNLNIGDAMGGIGLEGIDALSDIVRDDMVWMTPPPDMSVTITGGSIVFSEVIDALTSGRVFMTYLGLMLVFVGLLAIYRDLVKALVPVVTMFMVIGWTGGLMYYLGMVYTPMTATLGALILGVGSEYAVLMMERYYEEKDNGAGPVEAMQEASVKIGKAILTSGLTTIFGFSALIASPFSMTSNFGIVTVLDVSLALFATFVIFPPVIVTLDSYRERRKGTILEDGLPNTLIDDHTDNAEVDVS